MIHIDFMCLLKKLRVILENLGFFSIKKIKHLLIFFILESEVCVMPSYTLKYLKLFLIRIPLLLSFFGNLSLLYKVKIKTEEEK